MEAAGTVRLAGAINHRVGRVRMDRAGFGLRGLEALARNARMECVAAEEIAGRSAVAIVIASGKHRLLRR